MVCEDVGGSVSRGGARALHGDFVHDAMTVGFCLLIRSNDLSTLYVSSFREARHRSSLGHSRASIQVQRSSAVSRTLTVTNKLTSISCAACAFETHHLLVHLNEASDFPFDSCPTNPAPFKTHCASYAPDPVDGLHY